MEVARDARLVPRFAGGPYGPGDTVEGVLVAREAIGQARSLNGYLRYLDRSADFAGAATYDSAEPLHEGRVERDQEIAFALRIPDDAYPNWDDPSTARYGTLSWALVIEADIARGLDTTTTHAIPIDTKGRNWTGPPPTGEPELWRQVDKWDVDVTPDRWALRRGEELTVTVRIGEPKDKRPKLEVGVLCQAYYDIETTHTDAADTSNTEYRRETSHATLFEEWPQIDPSAAEQSFTVQIPDDAPFTYRGSAFGFKWSAFAREKRRFFQSDAGRVARLEVLP